MYDSKEASPSPAERHKPMFTQQETIDLYGHQWTMTFATLPAFERSVDRFTSAGIFVSGILISLLVFSIVSQQEKNRQRARALAREMTVELLESKKQADTLARKNELILNSAGEGIFGVDIKGGCIFVNPAAAEMLGFKVEELIGQRIHNIIHQRPAHTSCEKSEECPIHLTLRDGLAHHKNEDIFWRKDGTPFPVEYSSTPIWDESDQLSGTVVTFNDITEHLRAEKDRIIRQVAEQANKAKSAFIAHMSHEIRTPMNAVLGCTQILLGEQPSFSSRHVDLLQTIQRSGGHLLSLINDILDISKIEAGHVSRKETVFSLPNLLQEIQAVFRLSAENKGLRFFVYYDETLPPYVQADEGRLRQVLVNLLGNAIKFTEQGSVVLRAHADIIQNKTAEEPEILHLLFEVEDTGPGILQEDLGKIFIPFEQTSSGIRGDGTGLGLSISSKLVQLMGGRLTVESTPGQGSRFRFYIRTQKSEISPKLERVETRQIIGLETLRGSGGETLPILVVDDSETNRIYLHRILEMNGFKVVEASNGQEAIESFEHYSPQAVFMDIQMPVMDGLEASRRIKATDKGRNVPIIAITGYADEEYEQRGFMAGIDAYLGKPFIVEELFKVLGKCLHLSYKYQENNSRHSLRAPSLTAQDLATLPQELRAALRQSVEEGDISRLRELIARIKEHDVNTAQGLQALADEYEYDKIDALFEQEEN
jgi:PAS domain S-box-containing protein